jgi:A/G-specific adenine glycosylase
MHDAALLAAAPHLSSQWRKQYAQRLGRWYAEHHRDLPWRRTHDPYAIWVSETMLQQTQVATVIDYYQRFLARFPSVASLAAADEQEVLGLWAGLGYYRRARQLHAAARQLVGAHGGVFPEDVPSLMTLPGVGRYTAGAIASIAFDKPAPILEANTERLFARLLCLRESTRTPASLSILWQFAEWLLPRGASGSASSRVLNQAAMELGSLICKPLNPQCSLCPLAPQCPTAQQGLQNSIPVPKPKKTFTPLHHIALVVPSQQRWLMRLNPAGAWWSGLWDFPRVDITDLGLLSGATSRSSRAPTVLDAVARTRIAEAASSELGLQSAIGATRFSLTHTVTRYRILLDCAEATVTGFAAGDQVRERAVDMRVNSSASASRNAPPGWQWCTPGELMKLPLTAPARKIAKLLLKA